jgi:hypothetical protein
MMNTTIKKPSQETALHYRSLGLICRQQAALHPEASWRWLSEAERWEELAATQDETRQRMSHPPIAA